MSLEVIKKEFRRRRMAARKGRVSLLKLRVGALGPSGALCPSGALGPSGALCLSPSRCHRRESPASPPAPGPLRYPSPDRPARAPGDGGATRSYGAGTSRDGAGISIEGAGIGVEGSGRSVEGAGARPGPDETDGDEEDVMGLAAEIEAMLCSEGEEDLARDGRDPLDRMRSLWRAMRRLLPQLPLLKGSDMRKTELSCHFAGAVGFGWAPLPEWGCPEGADAYMARLSAYVDAAAARGGCGPSQLRLPLSSHGPPA